MGSVFFFVQALVLTLLLFLAVGLKLPAQSRGTSRSTGPTSGNTRLWEVPLRALPEPAPARSPFS